MERKAAAKREMLRQREEYKTKGFILSKSRQKVNKEVQRRWDLKRRYGITPEIYESMIVSQNNRCLICDVELSEVRRGWTNSPHIDHNHDTGKVRGILCGNCNVLTGKIEKAQKDGRLDAILQYITERS